MGKVADRLASRNEPQRVKARELLKVAARTLYDETAEADDALEAALRARLLEMSAPEFRQFRCVVAEEAAPRGDKNEVMEVLQDTLDYVCEYVDHESGDTSQLVALPLLLVDDEARTGRILSAAQITAVTHILKDHHLVAEDAKLTICPRLLAADEAVGLFEGHIYKLTQALAADDSGGAEAVTAQAITEIQALLASTGDPDLLFDEPSGPGPHLTLAILAAMVTSSDTETFPLTMELDAALEQTPDMAGEEADPENDPWADVQEIFEQAAGELVSVLQAGEVRLLAEPRSWTYGLRSLVKFERQLVGQQALAEFAREHTGGDLSGLCVDGDDMRFASDEYGLPGISAPLYRKSDFKRIGELNWPAVVPEEPVDTMDDLAQFLTANDMMSLENAREQAGPAVKLGKGRFSVVSKTRH